MNQAASSRPIRVGLIGVGNWATYGHLPALARLPEYEVVALQARRPDAARKAAEQFAVSHVFETEAELVAQPDVDLVAVLTTAPQHASAVRAVIAAGKDVYSEWPLTTSTAEATQLLALAETAGVRHVVGLQRRLAPVTRYLRDLVAQGFVGDLRSVRLHVSMNYFQALRAKALAWTVPPENFSSVVAIYAGHFLDMLFHALGRPAELASLLLNQFPQVTIAETGETLATITPDQLLFTATLGAAVVSVHVEGGKRNGSGVQLDLTGDAGDLRIVNRSAFGGRGEDYEIFGAHGDGLPLASMPVPAAYHWLDDTDLPSSVAELGHLYAGFARKESGVPTFDDALWLHRCLDACVASSREGRRIAIE